MFRFMSEEPVEATSGIADVNNSQAHTIKHEGRTLRPLR